MNHSPSAGQREHHLPPVPPLPSGYHGGFNNPPSWMTTEYYCLIEFVKLGLTIEYALNRQGKVPCPLASLCPGLADSIFWLQSIVHATWPNQSRRAYSQARVLESGVIFQRTDYLYAPSLALPLSAWSTDQDISRSRWSRWSRWSVLPRPVDLARMLDEPPHTAGLW